MEQDTYTPKDIFFHTWKVVGDEANDLHCVDFDDIVPFPPDYPCTFEFNSRAPGYFKSFADLESIDFTRVDQEESCNKLNRNSNIDISYRTDEYLESYRLKVNARQKKRVAKMNELFQHLDKKLPNYTQPSTKKAKTNSKYRILRRACQYINDLSNILSENKIY